MGDLTALLQSPELEQMNWSSDAARPAFHVAPVDVFPFRGRQLEHWSRPRAFHRGQSQELEQSDWSASRRALA